MAAAPSPLCGAGERRKKESSELTYPLKSNLSPPLLSHNPNTDNDGEYAINVLLHHQSEGHDRRADYIQLLSKKNLQASEDVLIELQERARTFLGSKSEVLLILGDSGAGKSTFGMRLENELWAEYKPGGPIPLFIDLKSIDLPDKDMIRQHLDELGFFTDQQIEDMRRSRQFILICDGYDEYHKWTNLHTKNNFNKPRQWQAKMIISCRTQYLLPNYRNYFEPETATIHNPDFSHSSDLFEEAVIVPLRRSQIKEYVELFAQLPRPLEYLFKEPRWSAEQYMERISNITHLIELAENPFMLKMILDVLPRLARTITKMTRVDLYDSFVELHFESEHQRQVNQHSNGKMDEGTFSMFTSLKSDDLIGLGLDFSKQLSLCIFKEQKGVNLVTYSAALDSNSWKASFFGSEVQAKLLRQTAQLVCRENLQDTRQLIRYRSRSSRKGNSYEFSHRSILEYFYSCLIFDPRGNSSELDLATCLDSTDSPLPVIKHPLGQTSIVSETSVVDFLSERVHQSEEFGAQLHNILQLSKAEAAIGQAAANAISILVRAGVRFNGADLRGIQVPGADMSCGDFDSAQLQGADLRKTILQNVWLHQADLTDSKMDGVLFGQWPYLEEEDFATQCVFSPDGKNLAVVLDRGSVSVYDTSTWKRIDFPGHTTTRSAQASDMESIIDDHSNAMNDRPGAFSDKVSKVSSIAYSPCSQKIVLGSEDRTMRLWDTRTGTLKFFLSDHKDQISSVAYSPNGLQVASGSWDKTVRLWDAGTGTLSHTLSGHSYYVKSVTYSPVGEQIASGSEDKTVRIWDTRTGALCSILSGHVDGVTSVAYSHDGQQIASGSGDQTVRLWVARNGALSYILSGHTSSVISVAFSSNGQHLASGSLDNTVRLWNIHTGSLISVLTGHTDFVVSVAFSPTGEQIASGSFDKTVRLWHSQTGTRGSVLSSHTDGIRSVACSPSNQIIVSSGSDKIVRLWDAQTGALSSTLSGSTEVVNAVACSPSSEQIASGSGDGTLRMWHTQTGTQSHTLEGHTDSVTSIAYSPNGQIIASGSEDKTVRLWDAQTGIPRSILNGHTSSVTSVAYSPNGLQVASGSRDKTVRLWDPFTGYILRGHTDWVTSAAYSPKGHQIASGSLDRTVRLWNAKTRTPTFTLRGHFGHVNCVAYSPDGRFVASGNEDKTVRLWGPDSGQCMIVMGGFQDVVEAVTWLGDTYIAGACGDGSINTWRVAKDENEIRVFLHWRSGPNKLVLLNACIQGVHDLSEMNMRLFHQQQQAVDKLSTSKPIAPNTELFYVGRRSHEEDYFTELEEEDIF